MPFGVSVVIPARDAAGTLNEALESLRSQFFGEWEAIIVDDGSSDDTGQIAADFVTRDQRFRLVSGPRLGVSAARNAGVASARYDWLLFLDADDLILPGHLETLTGRLGADTSLDAVHCGSARQTLSGVYMGNRVGPERPDLFSEFTRGGVFPIHACIVRRECVTVVGGFDGDLRTCEDLDLWQRVARGGARFGLVRDVLAVYRVRPGSASADAHQMLADGLRVIARGHQPDPRVPAPHPAHADGRPLAELPLKQFLFAAWCAGLSIGQGADARRLLDSLVVRTLPELVPGDVAANIFRAVSIGRGEAPSAWISIVGTVAERLDQFLQAIEERWKIAGLQREAWTTLEQLILDESPASLPTVVGRTYGLEVDVVDPIDDLSLPPGVERLRCTLLYAGTRLGPLHLPAFEGHVPGYVLKDAIVAEYAWPILRRYLQEALRPVLEVRTADGVTSIWRCGIQLATMRGQCAEAYSTEAHSQAGWMLFLQELWGMPSWTMDLFYSPTALEQQGHSVYTRDSWLEVEVSGPLPDVICQAPRLNVVVLVGGVPVGSLVTTLDKGRLRAPALRATINREVGFELCRAAVREGVLGQPVGGPGLRDRLAAAFARASAARVPTWFGLLPDNINAAPGWAVLAARALGTKARGALIARRPGPINSSLSRRAALPPQLASAIFEAAVIGGEPVIGEPHPPEPPVQILYAPELVWHTRGDGPTVTSDGAVPGRDSLNAARSQGRYSFERVFARDRDPWHYTSAYEQTKYEQTLNLLPPGSIGRALEVGCAEGHFTLQLAPRVASLVAADISSIALQRAATRCARHNNVHFVRLDLVTDQLPGPFDLVVCSELLYYVGDREDLKAAVRKLAEALTPGGYLLHAHAHLLVDDPDRTGFDWNMPFGARAIGEVMKDTQSLRLAKELRTPLYRIQLFRHGTPDSPAQVTEFNRQPTTLLPEVEAHVQWDGGTVAKSHQHPDSTDWLPILMYHQVAPSEAGVDDRYRLAPDVFEQQLAFLRGSGYYSVTLQGWRHAMAMHSPLPGRAILLTFDDGYRDFLTYAWPLLKRYGFSAQVFLVPDEIGGYNRWDRDVRRMAPLLDWNEIRGLQREGVTFGSHTASHPRLTALAPIETVQELVRSRATLSQKLGAPVDALAYPYGAADAVVQHLAGAVGYTFGLTCRRARSGLWESPMAMPRLEVRADDTFATFVSTLGV